MHPRLPLYYACSHLTLPSIPRYIPTTWSLSPLKQSRLLLSIPKFILALPRGHCLGTHIEATITGTPCGPNNAISHRLVLLSPHGGNHRWHPHVGITVAISYPYYNEPSAPTEVLSHMSVTNQFVFKFLPLGIRACPRGTKPCSPRPLLMPGVLCILHTCFPWGKKIGKKNPTPDTSLLWPRVPSAL